MQGPETADGQLGRRIRGSTRHCCGSGAAYYTLARHWLLWLKMFVQIDNEKDSIGQLTEKEMTQFVRRMADDDTAELDDYPGENRSIGLGSE